MKTRIAGTEDLETHQDMSYNCHRVFNLSCGLFLSEKNDENEMPCHYTCSHSSFAGIFTTVKLKIHEESNQSKQFREVFSFHGNNRPRITLITGS